MTQDTIHIDLEFPPAFLVLTRECEVYCVAGCCGLDAFSFDDQILGMAVAELGSAKAQEACESAIEFAMSHRAEKVECLSNQDDFNHRWANGEEFYNWTRDIVSITRKQIQIRTEHDGGLKGLQP